MKKIGIKDGIWMDLSYSSVVPEGVEVHEFETREDMVSFIESINPLKTKKEAKKALILSESRKKKAFSIGDVPMWFGRSDREALYSRIERESRKGNDSISIVFPTIGKQDVTLTRAKELLDEVASHADEIFDTKSTLLFTLEGLETVEEVDALELNFPKKIIINL